MSTGNLRVLLVDDHPVVRDGLRYILLRELPNVVIGEAADARSAIDAVKAEPWDVVVLDVTLRSESGIDVLRQIHSHRPELPVLILSVHPASQFEQRTIAAGAAGYVTKDQAPTELVQAIHRARRRHAAIDPAARPAESAPHDALSHREFQVMRMLGSGRTVSQIAEGLQLSVKTISTYRARILEKMGMATTAEIMRYCLENQLIDD